ncbi:MAG TPA: toxin-antitoxin system HicB family antitoxin [Nitrospirota bacterium]|nr:toxin-antitoxin system HicB family antitoxin [Nitrospirota bacterium]
MSKVKATDISQYEIIIQPNNLGGYYVRIPDFPGIFTGGDTWEDAIHHAREALEVTIETMQMEGIPLPEPKTKFSGQFNIRIPKDLHRRLSKQAMDEGVSLNAFITYLLTKSLKKAS